MPPQFHKRMLLTCLLISTACAACVDVPQPYELDHARIMAVRATPPSLAAGGIAQIEVLFTDSRGEPMLADPDSLQLSLPQQAIDAGFGQFLSKTANGWQLQCPDDNALAAVRLAFNLSPADPLAVPIRAVVTTVDRTLEAEKYIGIGLPTAGANPPVPEITVAGQLMTSEQVELAVGREVTIAVATPVSGYTYRWFSSVGSPKGFTRDAITVTPELGEAPPRLGLVVRTSDGGVSWRLFNVTLQEGN